MVVHPLRIRVIAENFIDERYNDKFKLNIFRICQEQLNNVLKHAHAAEAVISMEVQEGKILLTIADNGIGFSKGERKNGVGITNIKSRSELFNGKVEIISAEGAGTKLTVYFEEDPQILKTVNLQIQ
jgi:signal transduction histidine kinase